VRRPGLRTEEGVFECGDLPLQRGGTLKGRAHRLQDVRHAQSQARQRHRLFRRATRRSTPTSNGLVSPEHCLDPSRYFIVIPNMFTNGLSSSPSNTPGEFPAGSRPYDNVIQQRRLLNELFGVDRVKNKWSMAGRWAPSRPITGRLLFGDVGRAHRGQLRFGQDGAAQFRLPRRRPARRCRRLIKRPRTALRAMGRIYAGWALSQTFYRREMWRGLGFKDLEDFLVRSWEASFLRRNASGPDGPALDLGRPATSPPTTFTGGDLPMALSGIKAKVLLMPSATDLYFQTDDKQGRAAASQIRQAGRNPLRLGPPRRQTPPPISRTPPSSTSRSRALLAE